ncbi:hypothetical protein ACOMHN_039425 [Nucella lapillus]
MELGILHNGPPSTKRGCRAGRLHRLWHGLPPAPWPCTRSQHHSVPSRNLHPLMVPPFLQPHPDLQSAVGNAPLSSKHPAQLPTTDCLLSIISPMGGQPSDAPALSPLSPLQQGGQSSNAPALSPPSLLPQGGQPIALALSPPSPPPQGGQPSDAPGLSLSSSTLLLCPSDSTLSICHLNPQSAVKTGKPETISDYILEQKLDIMILTETWLSESGHETSCNLMTPSGFVLKSYPRASKGGGIAKPPKLTLDKLNSREKRSKKETKTPPTVAPWRGSDPVPKDTWRFNVLENDEGVKDVQKMRKKKAYGTELDSMMSNARSKVNSGNNALNTMRRSQSLSRLSAGITTSTSVERPQWAQQREVTLTGTSSTHGTLSRPPPVSSPPPKTAKPGASRPITARSARDPPSQDLFPAKPWAVHDTVDSDNEL